MDVHVSLYEINSKITHWVDPVLVRQESEIVIMFQV